MTQSELCKLFSRQMACVGGFWWVLACSNALFQSFENENFFFFPADEHWCRKMSSELAVQARPPRTIQLHLLSSAHRGLIWNWDWKQNGCNTGWTLTWVEIMLQALLFGELTLVCKTAQMLLPLNASYSKHCGGRLSRSILELSDEFHFLFECCSGISAQRCFLSGEKHTRNVLEKT